MEGNYTVHRSTYLKPAKLMMIYITVMPILYMYSIFDIKMHNRLLFCAFLLISNIFTYLGFKTGARHVKMSRFAPSRYFDALKFVNVLFWVALIISVPKYMLYTGDRSFNIFNKLIQIYYGRLTFLESYNARQTVGAVSGIWKIINLAVTLASPLHWMYIPLSMYYWKSLRLFKKIGSVFIIFLYVFQYVSSGASVGMMYFFIHLASTLLIKDAIQSDELRFKNRFKKLSRQKRTRVIVIAILVVVLFLAFGAIMNDRASGRVKTSITIGTEVIRPDENSLIWKLIPNAYKSTTLNVYAYLLKAYSALDMSLSIAHQVDIPLCFGAGNSWFLADNVKEIFGYDVLQQTYNMRIHEMFGYNYYTQWHTVYVWFANDFTFIGVPIALFILMMIWGMAWRDFLQTRNIFAFLLMVLFVEFVVFIPMNNQVFQHPETLLAFWGLFVYWLISRRKYNFIDS